MKIEKIGGNVDLGLTCDVVAASFRFAGRCTVWCCMVPPIDRVHCLFRAVELSRVQVLCEIQRNTSILQQNEASS